MAYNCAEDPYEDQSVSKETLALEVIAGNWGEGRECSANLRDAGYDPQVILREVKRIRRINDKNKGSGRSKKNQEIS
jgi:hypothetical protein